MFIFSTGLKPSLELEKKQEKNRPKTLSLTTTHVITFVCFISLLLRCFTSQNLYCLKRPNITVYKPSNIIYYIKR